LKVKLSKDDDFQLTSSAGKVAIGRFKNSLCFDCVDKNPFLAHSENETPKSLLGLLNKIRENRSQQRKDN
jgi:hypothetical protein